MTTERRTLHSWFHWSTWFAGRTQRAAAQQKAADFADYGTAFGLDLSLDPKAGSTPRPAAQPTPTKAPNTRR
ncbi:hypothetical protein [Sphaerotilus sp.]|jgi:hypothetical protein|uniref:hypothetical protein n=1 Tax=Sphaerotilus sp. TaxID=2093942 RepID=UPI0025D84827|nr:hypothetical protein [Sphaerotilus sp.]